MKIMYLNQGCGLTQIWEGVNVGRFFIAFMHFKASITRTDSLGVWTRTPYKQS